MSEERATYEAHAPRPERPLIVGIDPGEATGVAYYAPRGAHGERLRMVASKTFWEVQALLLAHRALVALVVVEDIRSLPIYAAHNKLRGRARDRLCRIDRDIALWEAWLHEVGIDVLMVDPSRQKKWDAERLKQITGWTAPTNQHMRDAVRLVWGRAIPHRQRLTETETEAIG